MGEGKAGVVRKCVDLSANATAGAGAGAAGAVVRACKCIAKRQQSLEETERELAIMRKLSGVPGVSQILDVCVATCAATQILCSNAHVQALTHRTVTSTSRGT